MNTFAFPENEVRPFSPALFGVYVTRRLRSASEVRLDRQAGLDFLLDFKGESIALCLEPLYERYLGAPECIGELVSEWMVALTEEGSLFSAGYDQTMERVLPMLQNLDIMGGIGLSRLGRPWAAGLGISYILESGLHYQYLQAEHLTRWGIDLEKLHEASVENLRAVTLRAFTEQVGEGEETLLVAHEENGQAARLALRPEFLQDWAARVRGDLWLGIPSQDTLVGFGEGHSERKELVAQVQEDALTRPRPLSSRVLVWREGQIKEQME